MSYCCKIRPVFLSVLLLVNGVASAQVWNCGGVFTNKPCSEKERTEIILPEAASFPVDQPVEQVDQNHGAGDVDTNTDSPDPDREKKRSAYHQLSQLASRARREFGIRQDIAQAELVCVDSKSSYTECMETVNGITDTIEQRIHRAEELSLKKRELDLAERKLDEEASNNTAVNIINNNHYLRRRRHREPISPRQTPQTLRRSGSSFSASGDIGSTKIEVNETELLIGDEYEEPVVTDKELPNSKTRNKTFSRQKSGSSQDKK